MTTTHPHAGIRLSPLLDPQLKGIFREAKPFPHVVMDQFVEPSACELLVSALEDEPAKVIFSEIFEVNASAPRVTDPRLQSFQQALESREVLAAFGDLCAKPLRYTDMRAFGYGPGQYLLPHTDHQESVGRALAYVFYLHTSPDLEGGELALFHCEFSGDEVVATTLAKLIEPKMNRLVLFEVSPRSLHEVREVTAGLRLSLAGWFYP